MRILVYPIRLAIGGAQINAVDLAAGVRDLGHDVAIFSRPGPLLELVQKRRVRYIPAPPPGPVRPSLRVMAALRRVIRQEGIDLVHVWGPNPWLEAFYAVQLVSLAPVVASFMDMSYVDYLPRTGPLIVGTRKVLDEARRVRTGPVELIEPPIDTDEDHPGVDGSGFREEYGVEPTSVLLVIVSRLMLHLKLESLERTIEATRLLASDVPIRLVVVGDGPARPALEGKGSMLNEQLGREVVTLTGAMMDPRPAYAAADLVLGMGSSILRGMAFGKAALVLGERGFSLPVNPETKALFLSQGFYGTGSGDGSAEILAGQMREVLQDDALRRRMGQFSRALVCDRFSIRAASTTLERLYRQVEPVSFGASLFDGVSTGVRLLADKTSRKTRRLQPSTLWERT